MNTNASLTPQPRRARTGTMLEGAAYLVFCAWAAQHILFPDWLPGGVWIAAVVLGLGLLLLVIGIVAATRGDRHPG